MVEINPETIFAAEPMALTSPLCPRPRVPFSQPAWLEEDRLLPSTWPPLLGGEVALGLHWELSSYTSEAVEEPKLYSEESAP